jgi:hypothetical protein
MRLFFHCRNTLSVVGFAFALLALGAGSATAAPSSASSTGATKSLCTVAHGVARDIINSTSISNGKMAPANVKATYEKVAAAEPALLASASGPIKTDLQSVFGFVNLVIVDFKKVNWNAGAIAPYAPTLLTRAAKIQRPLGDLKVYFHKTCKIDL